jgi:Protein of unknown function (DUF2817)
MRLMLSNLFPISYFESRTRFIKLAREMGAKLVSHSIGHEATSEFTIDVATVGAESASTILITSGLHGVEGFAGAAIQFAILNEISKRVHPPQVRFVLVHALNPYGFAKLRRVNEDNVDLNRNFLSSTEQFAGAPSGYSRMDHFLNPTTAPKKLEPFKLTAIYYILSMGMSALKESIAGGQYEFPTGLFYGGARACATTHIVEDQCAEWIGDSKRIIHLDVHTGLGAFGDHKLLLDQSTSSEELLWIKNIYGNDKVELLSQPKGTAYKVSGLFCHWMQTRFRDRDYRAIGAEFGTYGVLRVLAALRTENQAHHYCDERSLTLVRAKQELLECFCPASTEWRRKIIAGGLNLIHRSEQALLCEQGVKSLSQ